MSAQAEQKTHERELKELPTDEEVRYAMKIMMDACHGRAWNAGWWHNLETGEPVERNFGDICSLIHSEVSEAYEAHRKNKRDDHLPAYPGKTVEFCDVLIRVFDHLGGTRARGNDGAEIVVAKMHVNDHRADHKPENRLKDGGKKL